MTIIEAKRKLKLEVEGLPQYVGIGISTDRAGEYISVKFASELAGTVVPSTYDGFRVKVDITGRPKAYEK